jgi:hypothetical protein
MFHNDLSLPEMLLHYQPSAETDITALSPNTESIPSLVIMFLALSALRLRMFKLQK